MDIKHNRILAAALAASAALIITPAAAETFQFKLGHTAIYTAFDSDADDGDISANTFDFTVRLADDLHMGAYYETLDGEGGTSANIRGLTAEHPIGNLPGVSSSIGLMLGQASAENVVTDIYGRFGLEASDNADLFAKVAYRSTNSGNWDAFGDDDPDDLDGLYLNVGFGFGF